MVRYNLDDLGAYQFEKLAQSLLKTHVGITVESWGNRGDFGRDAYTINNLRFPNKEKETSGPFLFQVKFVEGANAAGAKPAQALNGSLSKEIAQIKERKKIPKWRVPAYFTFMTNSLIASDLRDDMVSKLRAVLPTSTIVIWGGDDICDMLDQPPHIYRSFPQLLSIRDLDVLIHGVLSHESIVRSATAIESARELVPVFAPTFNYEKTWRVLRKYHFAVLEGPPEVGKSAIAWMVGLSQAGIGWEAVFCNTPKSFFEMYDSSTEQIFIADDAFGRTEYDPARTSIWEAELNLVMHRLDARHWLIWTSRKHILERAVARMDVAGKARSFPDPGAVLVDVQSLSVEERALILFRHARAAYLEEESKTLLRGQARLIIHHPDFTPERIRRFVDESLPLLVAKNRSGQLKPDDLKAEIREAIRNPTKQMRLTFRNLPPALKWYLISILEMPERSWLPSGPPKLKEIYESYCQCNEIIPFEEVTKQLNEAFIRVREGQAFGRYADWIHPSYRDLVIEELTADSELRTQFLRRASLEGVKIAVSDTGGQEGKRMLPFMLSAESWTVLQERCLSIVSEHDEDRALLEVLSSAATRSTSHDLVPRWNKLLKAVCEAVRNKWNETQKLLDAEDIATFERAKAAIGTNVGLPDFDHTWNILEERFRDNLQEDPEFNSFDLQNFENLTCFAHQVEKCAPGFLTQRRFPDKYESEILSLIETAGHEFSILEYSDDQDELTAHAREISLFAGSLERISEMSSSLGTEAYECSERLNMRATEFEEKASELEPPEPDYDDYDDRRSSVEDFDINGLFAEL